MSGKKSKKGWIDRSRSTTYVLGEESSPLGQHEEEEGTGSEEDDIFEDNNFDEEEGKSGEEADDEEGPRRALPPRLRPAPGAYDYEKHMRPTGARGGVFVTKEGRVIPSEERPDVETDAWMAMMQQERALLADTLGDAQAAEDEVAETFALVEEGKLEELDDAFLAELRQGNGDDEEEGEEEDEDEDDEAPKQARGKKSLFDIDDDFDDLADADDEEDDEEEDVPSLVAASQRTSAIDELFDLELQRFDGIGETNDPDSDEMVEIDEGPPSKKMDKMWARMIAEGGGGGIQKELYEQPEPSERPALPLHVLAERADTAGDLEFEWVPVKKTAEWDAESVLSTRTRDDNHPALLDAELAVPKRIRLRRGMATLEDSKEETSDDESDVELVNKGAARSRNETPAERKARKAAVKAERQERRQEKKTLKDAFKDEEQRQRRIRGQQGLRNKTVVKF